VPSYPQTVEVPEVFPRRILRLPEVCAITGRSRPTIYRHMNQGRFPVAIKLGEKSIGWFSDEIEAWLDSLPRVEIADPGATKESA